MRRSRYGLRVRFEMRMELMEEADEKGSGPLRFGVAGRVIDLHGRLPFVKVDALAYHGFRQFEDTKPNRHAALVRRLHFSRNQSVDFWKDSQGSPATERCF